MPHELPVQPRLSDGIEVVTGPGDDLQLRGCTPPLRLSGRMVHRLLPLLDGTHQLEAITASLTEWTPEQVRSALDLLAERGLLRDGRTAPLPLAQRAQIAFYGMIAGDQGDIGERAYARLRTARIHLCGWGPLLAECERILRRCGCEALTADHWEPPTGIESPTEAKSALPGGASPTSPEEPRAPLPFPGPAQYAERLPADAELVLLALPRPAPALLEAANSTALRLGAPLLPVVLDQGEAIIGPTILPGESPCYHCFTQRLLVNHPSPEADAAYAAHLDRPAAGITPPEWPPFTAAIAALSSMEAVRIVTGFAPPVTPGQVLFINGVTGNQQSSRVWKLPRCPVCQPERSRTTGGLADGR